MPCDPPLRLVIHFAIDGDLRFISHRDCMRLFQRALVRARVPVRYSSGFNPRIRLQLPLPRSVGIAAENEALVFETTETVEPREILDRLTAQMPSGLSLLRATRIAPGLRPRPVEAEYRLTIRNGLRTIVSEAAARLLDAECIEVRREPPGRNQQPKTLNIRPFINTLEVTGGEVAIRVHLTPAGTVRPREVLEALGLPADEHMSRLRRSNVTWDMPWTASTLHDEKPDGATKKMKESAID